MDQKVLTSRDIIGRFYQTMELAGGSSWVPNLSMLFPTNQETENYKWLGFSPALSAFVGSRRPQGLKANGVSITNVLYDATLEVNVDDLRRDKSGQILIRVQELADRAMAHWASLLSVLIEAGASTACYDGQYFFDSDHSEGASGTQKNALTSSEYSEINITTADNPTAYELAVVILKMIQHIYTFKDDQGQPMNYGAKKFMVMVPINMMGAALQAVSNPTLNTGSGVINNPLSTLGSGFSIAVEPNPYLTSTTKLYCFRIDGRARPFIRQAEDLNNGQNGSTAITEGSNQFDETMGVKVTAIAEGSEYEKLNRAHLYMVETSRNVGYGYWQHAVQVTLS